MHTLHIPRCLNLIILLVQREFLPKVTGQFADLTLDLHRLERRIDICSIQASQQGIHTQKISLHIGRELHSLIRRFDRLIDVNQCANI